MVGTREEYEAVPAPAASNLSVQLHSGRNVMANEDNRVVSHIREQMKTAHWLMEGTLSDVSEEMFHFAPPGKALPIGAALVHYVSWEDWMIHSLLKGGAPLMAGPWAGKTGVSEPQPEPGDDYEARFAAWSRRVRVDLPAFQSYAKAVYEATDGYLASLADPDLTRELDLSGMGMGTQAVGSFLAAALIGHAYCHCGEISAIKGVQGKKGYPF
jgi:hypothetical protein